MDSSVMRGAQGGDSANTEDDEDNILHVLQGSKQPRPRVPPKHPDILRTARAPKQKTSSSARQPAATVSSSSPARERSAKHEITPPRNPRSSASMDETSLGQRLSSLSLRPPVRSDKAAPPALVVAIDFRTTYSSIAFSFNIDFENDPLRVQCLDIEWGNSLALSAKIPTAILFNPDQEFDSFGYEAEEKYAKMEREDATKWFMFDRFKMKLHSLTTLSRDMPLLDKTRKKSMKALDVFSAAIRHLKEHALRELLQKQREHVVQESDVTWVLTVPAIWDDGAKQFMREAATKAGLDNSRLELALEPEAASIYCLHYFQANPASVSISTKGARFLTVDCGESKVDLSVFEVGEGSRLRQLHKLEGVACGGTLVDKAFRDLLMKVLGFDGMSAVDNLEHLHLMREFEKVKGVIGYESRLCIRLPPTMREQLSVTLRNRGPRDELSMVKDNLLLSHEAAKALFEESIRGIVAAIETVLNSREVGHVNAILLVGGFSESKVIQDAVRAAFPQDLVLVPPSPSLTVVMGAVQFGHNPNIIATKTTFTRGSEESRHPRQRAQLPLPVTAENSSVTLRTPRPGVRLSRRQPPVAPPSSSSGENRFVEQDTTPSRDSLSFMDVRSMWEDRSSLTHSPPVSREQASSAAAKSRVIEPRCVVAIDFGTTYSGFAFCDRADFERDPLSVQCLNILSQDKMSQAAKIFTAILFNPDQEFDCFGYEAEEKYATMEREDATKWFMFDRFKMVLHSKTTLSREILLLDKTGKKSMKAFDVFSAAIRHLKEHALRELLQKQREHVVQESDVTWVLTVPAIWDDGAKQFMREAATKAGLDNSRLELALEPEAASIYCLHYFQANPASVSISTKGARILTVDCGGGTVDLSVFEVEEGSRLRQLHKPEGAACGGTLVDKAFKNLLMKVLGFDGLAAVDNMEHLHLMRGFEEAKHVIGFATKIFIRIPSTMKEQLSVTLNNSRPEDELSMVKDQLILSGKAAKVLFEKSIRGIVAAIETVLNSREVGHVNAILLVGGFSESKVIQDAVKAAFPQDLILVPPSPSLTVVMGAVQCGHTHNLIARRTAVFTRGIEGSRQHRESVQHPTPVVSGPNWETAARGQRPPLPSRKPAAMTSTLGERKRKAQQKTTSLWDPVSSLAMDFMFLSEELPSQTTRPTASCEQALPTPLQSRTLRSQLVVAIDFGTTYSGFAFSFKTDFEADPLRVQCLNILSQDEKSQAAKVPTTILFNPDQEFDCFGYEAEEKYAKMEREVATKWFMFDRFKMKLHSTKTLSRDMTVVDKTRKKSMKAFDVFSAAIRHLKEHAEREMLPTLEDHALQESDVTWVLTVPAIWDDGAKQFMREAATKAGLDNSRLELALEPEAASIYCLHYFQANPASVSISTKGARFLTVDCGGGTVDLSVFEVGEDSRLRQLHKPEGAACGGILVDKAFKDLLTKVLGFDGLAAVENLENLHLMREFEIAKNVIGFATKIAIKFPPTMKEEFIETLEERGAEVKLSMVKDQLMLPDKVAEAFFNDSITGIVDAIQKVISSPEVGHVDIILLVGGFSESKVIQDAIKAAFPQDLILVPPSPSLSVLTGAVQFSHNPNVIATRIAAFTYGIEVEENFVEDYHDPSKKKVIGGHECCTGVFDAIIKVNARVAVDQQLPFHTITPAETDQRVMHLKVYRSPHPQPKYVTDEDCVMIGSVTVRMPDLRGDRQRQVQVTMSVSGTELQVQARDQTTGLEFSTTCDLLPPPQPSRQEEAATNEEEEATIEEEEATIEEEEATIEEEEATIEEEEETTEEDGAVSSQYNAPHFA